MSTTPFSPRLLAGPAFAAGAESLADHRRRVGPLPSLAERRAIIPVLDASGLLGRGGAAFPVARKWRGIAERSAGAAVVVVNGAEGEPGSGKDRALMTFRPQLVLDGASIAADAIGAEEIVVYVGAEHGAAASAMRQAIDERAGRQAAPTRLVAAPRGYVSGEQSAAVHYISSGDARPTSSPPRPYERGVRNLPTLVQNVESLAHVALLARYGDGWYRSAGRGETRGSALVTVGRPAARPGVQELEVGTTVGEVLERAGADPARLQAVLLGGFFGTWARLEDALELPLDPATMRAHGLTFGSGVVSLLGIGDCGVRATAQVMAYMAGESAGQCGPCVFGLAAIADASRRLAEGSAEAADLERLERWSRQLRGRGACAHPDGAVGLLASALVVFDEEFRLHQDRRRCSAGTLSSKAA